MNAVVYDRATDPSLFDFDAASGTITLLRGYDVCVEVPAEIGGVPVRTIGDNAFANHPNLCVLTLPEGLEIIGASAFEWCGNLVSVDFPATLKSIGSRAFCAGYKGYALELPAVETIGDEAFAWCVRITDPVYLPEGLKTIGRSAFDGCSWLGEVYVPATVEAIGEYAFLHQTGEAAWALERCITDPDGMPDAEALLAAVKREPMAAPEPTALPAPAVPVGEEGKDFFGLWIGTEMDMGGEVMQLSDYGIIMNLLLLEDGRMIATDKEITDWSALEGYDAPGWRVENGVAIGDTCTMTLQEDGRLLMEEESLQVYFRRSDEQPDFPSAPAQSAAPAAGAQRTGIKYICESADVSGYNMAASMLGGEYSLIFREDGTAVFVIVGNEMPGITWKQLDNGNFQIDIFGTPEKIVWTDACFDMNYMDAMLMHFIPAE